MTFDWDAPVKFNLDHEPMLCGNTGRYGCSCDGRDFDTPEEMLAHLRANGITAVPTFVLGSPDGDGTVSVRAEHIEQQAVARREGRHA